MNELVKTEHGYAREASEPLGREQAPDGLLLRRFTVYTVDEFGDPSEELDFDATTGAAANKLALDVLKKDYEPGLTPVETVEQFGLYM